MAVLSIKIHRIYDLKDESKPSYLAREIHRIYDLKDESKQLSS